MTTVIDASNSSTATAYSNQRKVDRCQNGVLWYAHIADTGLNNLNFSYSTDDGATWSSPANGFSAGTSTRTYTANASFFIDADDFAHVVYKHHADGYIYYRRGTPNAERTAWTWSSAYLVDGASSFVDVPDIVVHREGTGWVAHIVNYLNTTNANRIRYSQVTISSSGTLSTPVQVGIATSVSTSGGGYPSIDFNHTGDGKTVAGGTPHLYVAWSYGTTGSGQGIRFRKATYSGGSWTWGTEREIDSTRYINSSAYWLNCLFDGTRVIFAGQLYDGANYDVVIHERDAADTTTTTRVLLDNAPNADTLLWGSSTFDGDGNVYLFGVNAEGGFGARDFVYRKWTRATATLEAEVVVQNNAGTAWFSAKRGHSNNSIEWVYTDGTSSPYDVTYGAIALNAPPNAPTLVYPTSNAVIDVDNTNRFDWDFSDPDAGDTQSEYELRYRIVGAPSWTTVSGATPNTYRNIVAGTLAAGDYEWQVRTADSQGEWGAWSGSGYFTGATAPDTPTITDPINGFTIGTERYTVRWSTPSQSSYQVRKVADDGAGNPDTATVYSDTGEVAVSSTRVRTLDFPVNNRDEHIQVRIKSNTLWSAWASVLVHVSYTPPAIPTLVVTPNDSQGNILVDITNPPRNLLTSNQSSLETDTLGWVAGTGTAIARTTDQAAHGSASLQLTNNSGATGTVTAELHNAELPDVIAGGTYTALASYRAASVDRNGYISIAWYDSGGALISTDDSFPMIDVVTAGWAQAELTAIAPANAVSAKIIVRVVNTGANEVHYVDKIALKRGNDTAWVEGGQPVVTYNEVYRRRTDETSWSHRVTGVDVDGSWIDYEAASGVTYEYRVTARGDNGTSSISAVQTGSVTLSEWRLRDPYDHSRDVVIEIEQGSLKLDTPKDAAVFNPLGRERVVVVEDVVRGDEFSLTMGVVNADDYTTLRDMLRETRTYLIQSPIIDENWYVRFRGSLKRNIMNTNDPYAHFTVECVEVDEPANPR